MRTNFQMVESFQEYRPQENGITSLDEIKQIEEHFCLVDMTGLELQNLRDMVVLMYQNWMQSERNKAMMDYEKFFGLSDAMQSITAVIDRHIYGC